MRPFEAVLFDLDGVVVDTYQAISAFWQTFAREHQLYLTPEDFRDHVYGYPASHTMQTLFPHFTTQQQQTLLERLKIYECESIYQEIPGVMAFLQTLSQYTIAMAIVTGAESWKVETVTRQFGLDNLFAACITASDIQHGKPDPACYFAAAQALQKDPSTCLVFEDTVNGVHAAVAAGTCCIGIASSSYPSALLEAGASCVIPDFQAIYVQKALVEDSEGIEIRVKRRAAGSSFYLEASEAWRISTF